MKEVVLETIEALATIDVQDYQPVNMANEDVINACGNGNENRNDNSLKLNTLNTNTSIPLLGRHEESDSGILDHSDNDSGIQCVSLGINVNFFFNYQICVPRYCLQIFPFPVFCTL